ncbi:hypothetical protein K469DRAFT_547075 [Zopfia rhizophila CBS 207.26]|uniref:Zn(2)-C6 fungal-type domain-containing protein n=1 Tax=Zopfia rhizophila CBS 207.26 TaxID=1314779 RepID=A0A6A6EUV1_9PEZI|nr:hypothetical protein K469DRAFT_547075 [Zopfia rhizophila CBS 207.26]
MGRRHHRKSRLGCIQCKRRHIKCDENHPVCVNCSTGQLRCSYVSNPIPGPHISIPTPQSQVTSFSALSPRTPLQDGSLAQPVYMHHMELLSHFLLDTSRSLGDEQIHHSAYQFMFASSLSVPYLVNEILAITALHLSQLRPARAKFYSEEAAVFQTNALSLFNSTTVDMNAENAMSMLLFSSLLGIHMLADAVTASDSNNANFLDKFIVYLDIHRGVRAVTNGSWEFLRQSKLSPILESAASRPKGPCQEEAALVCDRLRELLEAVNMSETSLNVCKDAIRNLQWVFESEPDALDKQSTTGLIFAWPILLSAEFTDLLLKRKPEPLIILAHYAVLLHKRRELWVVGGAGRILIESITNHLGTYWKQWLIWPNQVLQAPSSDTI